jgi:hypothetical protein
MFVVRLNILFRSLLVHFIDLRKSCSVKRQVTWKLMIDAGCEDMWGRISRPSGPFCRSKEEVALSFVRFATLA